jgi:hypothetical protein
LDEQSSKQKNNRVKLEEEEKCSHGIVVAISAKREKRHQALKDGAETINTTPILQTRG